jgi:uncharacterized protein (TIGR03083 family)
MTHAAIDALRAEHSHALELFDSFTDAEWAAASACAGWRVQDVVQHMASTFHLIADAASIEVGTTPNTERNNDVPVDARRDWTPAQVLTEYREWSEKGIATLAAMQEPPLADMVAPLADLGSHPLRLLANAISFDHYCHLRHDIGVVVARAADLPHDPLVLEVTIEWMMAGAPQMCAAALADCTVGVNLVFTDLQHVLYTLRPGGVGERWEVAHGTDPSLPVAVTSAHEFVSWATKRNDWRPHTQLTDQSAAATLDALNII